MSRSPSLRAPTLGYVPALDGVRAIAVISVLLFHGGVAAFGGGFLGVDIFFVLSGYLITTLLMLEVERTGTIDLVAFYRRRMRRLMPALVMTLVIVAAYTLVADRASWATIRADGLASILYVPNWHFIHSGQSYFDQFARPSPLRHMWSLGIEEQWYLVWPALALVVLRRVRHRWVLACGAAVLGLASACWMAALATPEADPSRAYYGTDTRAQALLAGAALAFVLPAVARRVTSRGATAATGGLGAAALAALGAVMVTTTEGDAWLYEGGFAFVAVLAAACIAGVVLAERSPLARLVGCKPFAAVGRVSYGLYLFHWPIFVTLTPARVGLDGAALLAVRVAMTVAVTVASYRIIEQPIRLRPAKPIARQTAIAMAALAAVFAIPAAVITPSPMVELASTANGTAMVRDSTAAEGAAGAPLDVLMVGDSVAAILADRFPAAAHPGVGVEKFALLGCGVTPGRAVVGERVVPLKEGCENWDRWWAAGARGAADVAVVVIGAWEVADQKVGDQVHRAGSDAASARLTERLLHGIDQLGDRPVVVLNVPCFREESMALGGAESPRNERWRIDWINGVIDRAAQQRANVSVADLRHFLCPTGEARATASGEPLRYDGVHFTPPGAAEVWDWLVPQLRTARDVSTASPPADDRAAA